MFTPGVATPRESTQPPRWLVAIIVLITAGATAWAMSATGLEGSRLAWDELEQNVTALWASPPARGPATATEGWARPVAGLTGAPTITAGASPPHLDRGACTSCHTVLTPRSTPMPRVAATTTPPHTYFGPCRNCHLAPGPSTAATAVPGSVAAAPAGPVATPSPMAPYGSFVAGAQPPPPAVAPPPPPPRQPTEAEWMGLEVSPANTGAGVVIGGAESVAARMGMMAGDVVSSINGAKIVTMLDFVAATDNGRLARGIVIVKRNGQRLAFELDNSPPAAPPGQPNPAAPPGQLNPAQTLGATTTWSQPPAATQPSTATAGSIPGLPPGGSIVGPGMPERRF